MGRKPAEEGFSLNLTFTIDTRPDLATMNDLAMSLRFLPHVDRIKFEKLYNLGDRLVNVVQSVIYAIRVLRAMTSKKRARFQRETELLHGSQSTSKKGLRKGFEI